MCLEFKNLTGWFCGFRALIKEIFKNIQLLLNPMVESKSERENSHLVVDMFSKLAHNRKVSSADKDYATLTLANAFQHSYREAESWIKVKKVDDDRFGVLLEIIEKKIPSSDGSEDLNDLAQELGEVLGYFFSLLENGIGRKGNAYDISRDEVELMLKWHERRILKIVAYLKSVKGLEMDFIIKGLEAISNRTFGEWNRRFLSGITKEFS